MFTVALREHVAYVFRVKEYAEHGESGTDIQKGMAKTGAQSEQQK
jgi:hypothetical protein